MYNTTQITNYSTESSTSLMNRSAQSVSDRYNTTIKLLEVFSPEDLYVNQFVTPVIYGIGFPGNILSFTIWIQHRMRQSSGYYLAALALSDLLFLTLNVVYELQEVWLIQSLDLPVLCETYTIVYLSSQYLSPLLVLGFTVERYISVCHPFRRERYCTTRRAKIVIVCLTVFTFCLCGIQAYFYKYDYSTDKCTIREEVIIAGTRSLWSIWTWTAEMLMFLFVPLLVLFFNVCVIKEVRRLSTVEQVQLHGNEQRTSATTIMLLSVSFYLIFTTLPIAIVQSLYFSFPEGVMTLTDEAIKQDPTWRRYFTYSLIRTIVNEIGITHFACNFYIYLITGKVFRKELKKFVLTVLCSRFSSHWPSEYTNLFTSTRASTRTVSLRLSVNGSADNHKNETAV